MTRLDPSNPAVKAADAERRRTHAKSATDAYRVGDDVVVSAEQGQLMWDLAVTFPDLAVVPEYRFNPVRRWRFDIAMPDLKLAVEVDGGVYSEGRHTRGDGYERDTEKMAEAMCDGWRVLRVTTGQVKSGQATGWLRRIIEREEAESA